MKRKGKKGKHFSLDTLIGVNTVFEGAIHSECSVCVEGTVRGTIEAKGEVVVGRQGKVEADIHADSVVVGGHVVGNIDARRRLEITAMGRVTGDVEATTIIVAEGGMVDGSFKMMETAEATYPQVEKDLSLGDSNESDLQTPSDRLESLPQA